MATDTKQVEIAFCQSCGQRLSEENAFCPKCGKEIPRQAEVGSEPPPNPRTIPNTSNNSNVMYASNTGQTSNAPARKMLKIVGIIGIIVSSLDILMGIGIVVISSLLFAIDPTEAVAFVTTGMIVMTIVVILFAIYSIFTSIYAVLNCGNLSKAGVMQILGMVRLGTTVIAGVMTIVMYGWLSAALIPLGFILPIFYVIGASKNKAAFVGQKQQI